MSKSFTGVEFVKALAEGGLKPAILLEGVAKLAEGELAGIRFSKGTSCALWVRIPVHQDRPPERNE
jgi:hypothetical protein